MSYNGFTPNTSLDKFRVNMTGIQPPHSYSAFFMSPNSQSLSTYPDMIQFPSRDITVLDYEPYGYGFKIPTAAANGQLLCSFILLEPMSVLHYFENWIELIQNINMTKKQNDKNVKNIKHSKKGRQKFSFFRSYIPIPFKTLHFATKYCFYTGWQF